MARYKSVIALNSSVFFLMIGVGMIVALLPGRIIALSGSVSDVGYLASFFAVPFVLLQIPIGRLADRFGFGSFLICGYVICAITGLTYCFSTSSNLIFIGRILQGVGEIPVWALAPALLSLLYPADKGKVMGMYNASIHIGLTVGSLPGILIPDAWHGNEAFWVFVGVSLLGAILIALFVENPQAASPRTAKPDLGSIMSMMSDRANRIVFAGIVLYGAGYGVFMTFVPAYLISVKNSDQTSVGVFFTVFYVALGLSQLIGGVVADRKRREMTMVCGLMMTGIALGVFAEFSQPWIYGLLFVGSFGLGVFSLSSMVFLNERVSESSKGTISGAFNFANGIGYFLGPLILGKTICFGDFRMGWWVLSGLFVCEGIALAFMQQYPLRTAEAVSVK